MADDPPSLTDIADAAGVATAALLVIGDEILSGRTKDRNIGHVAETLTEAGIDLREVRVVPDVEEEIVEALNALRARYDTVLTTGGIGPTHDDITADAVARAFGVSIDHDPRAVALLRGRFGDGLNEARLRMARIPAGADLVENPVSTAPGFRLGNVVVMAGVPSIMQAMLANVLPSLPAGPRMLSESLDAGLREGDFGSELGEVARRHPDVAMGSYPFMTDAGPNASIVLRARVPAKLAAAKADVEAMLRGLRANLARA